MAGSVRSIGGLAKKAATQQKSATIKVGGKSITGSHQRGSSSSNASGHERALSRSSKPTSTRTGAKREAAAEPPKPVARGSVQADTTVLSEAIRARRNEGGPGGNRGTVLSSVYGMAKDGKRAVRGLQSFNGNRGGRLVLGQ